MCGHYKGQQIDIAVKVSRKIGRLHWMGPREKADGTAIHVGIHSSKVSITRLKLDSDYEKPYEVPSFSK
ncbi:60S ribosomal protein L26-like 1 [Fukomys damarensis]|uniref:60S ribosomal protein L26-like 1 n=1 Tax=Fukomys damarensis TaxID=885580 RepID=A0A091DNH7_FUKDA|nr:60S ribosomal protein L26-like 1 [Fukomys damarensis]